MKANAWENEYQKQRLVTMSDEPQTSVKDFLRWVRRERKMELENLNILDLGCGNGKNTLYIVELDPSNRGIGIDIAPTALQFARENATKRGADASFIEGSIGAPLVGINKKPLLDNSFDIALDITSSNSLSENERAIYLSELHRTLKPTGYAMVRALCKDGDENAKNLLKISPGQEKDTYIMPELSITERIFSKEDILALYSSLFTIHHIEKETHYTTIETPKGSRKFKRNFWILYLQKK